MTTPAPHAEPKMAKFRLVRAGWWTTPIVTFDEVMEEIRQHVPHDRRRYEEHLDVSRYGDEWIVSIRGGKDRQDTVNHLNQHSLFAQRVSSLAQGRRYAMALKAYLAGEGEHPDWILRVFSAEDRAAHHANIERIVGKPYEEWEAEMEARAKVPA